MGQSNTLIFWLLLYSRGNTTPRVVRAFKHCLLWLLYTFQHVLVLCTCLTVSMYTMLSTPYLVAIFDYIYVVSTTASFKNFTNLRRQCSILEIQSNNCQWLTFIRYIVWSYHIIQVMIYMKVRKKGPTHTDIVLLSYCQLLD